MTKIAHETIENVTATTTDVQIAVRAAQQYYDKGAPPETCVRLVDVCLYLDRLPQGGWPETVQGWQQARETWSELTESDVRRVCREVRRLQKMRMAAQSAADLVRAHQIAKPHAVFVESIVDASGRICERPDHNEFYVDVILSARPDLTREQAVAISTVCVARFA